MANFGRLTAEIGSGVWDYISSKWTLTEDNDMMLLYKGWFDFTQPLYVRWWLSLDW